MKLTIFGATGSVGRNIVQQALEQGHQVTAHTRSPEKFDQSHASLKIFKGDVLDSGSVASAITSAGVAADAVICALGMPLMNKQGLRARGTRNIITAMQQTGVKRLLCLSGLGAGDSRAILPFHYRYILVPLFMRHLYADHELQEKYVKSSNLDWTIIRPGNFIKGSRTGKYQHGFTVADRSMKFKISRPDLAEFMLHQLTDEQYMQKTPNLSY